MLATSKLQYPNPVPIHECYLWLYDGAWIGDKVEEKTIAFGWEILFDPVIQPKVDATAISHFNHNAHGHGEHIHHKCFIKFANELTLLCFEA